MKADGTYHDLVRYLRKVVLLSERVGDRVAQREIGIGRAPYLILRAIAEDKILPSQQALAERLSLTKGAVSRQIAFLQKQGCLKVEESAKSRRENSLVLTQKGRNLVRTGTAAQARLESLLCKRLRGDDVAGAIRILRVFCEHLEEEEKRG